MAQPMIEWTNIVEHHTRYPSLSDDDPGTVLELVIYARIVRGRAEDKITAYVNLEGSSIRPGALSYNKDHLRGFYQDRVTVSLSLEKHPELLRISDGPLTQSGASSFSSSVSVNSGVSVSGGFFGYVPTGGVSASSGEANSRSYSRSLPDFRVINKSDSHTILHDYRMSNTGSGRAYHTMHDLLKDESEGILDTLPDLATSNLPIISQAIWQARSSDPIDETVMLHIKVRQHLAVGSVLGHLNHDLTFGNSWRQLRRTVKKTSVAEWDPSFKGYIIYFNHYERIPFHKLVPEERVMM